MKIFPRLFLLILISLFCNSGIASHIKASYIKTANPFHGFAKTTTLTLFHNHLANNSANPEEKTKQAKQPSGDKAINSKQPKTADTTSNFNNELQWRILNLLARQLFVDSDRKSIAPLMLSQRIYTTQTFSVDISPANSGFLEIQIIDAHPGKKTRLQIPRL